MRVTLYLLILSLGLAMAFFGHAFATGIVLPYPDPTPAQAANQRFHGPISSALFLASAAAFMACMASAAIETFLLRLARRRQRP